MKTFPLKKLSVNNGCIDYIRISHFEIFLGNATKLCENLSNLTNFNHFSHSYLILEFFTKNRNGFKNIEVIGKYWIMKKDTSKETFFNDK